MKNENIIETFITKEKNEGIKLQPIPMSLRLTFPISTEKTMLKNISNGRERLSRYFSATR